MKIKIIQPALAKNRKDSFWYDGKIAFVEVENGVYSLEAFGNIRVQFEKDGDIYIAIMKQDKKQIIEV